MQVVALSVVGLALAGCFCVPRTSALGYSVAMAPMLAIAVHTEMTQSLTIVYFAVVSVGVLFGLLVSDVIIKPPPLAYILFVTLFCGWRIISIDSLEGVAFAALSLAAFVLVGFGAASIDLESPSNRRIALRIATATLTVLTSLAAYEVLLGGRAVWPRNDGFTYRLVGTNEIVPFFQARGMATLSYAITLGLVIAVLTVVARSLAEETDRRRGLVLIIGVFGVLLSGTRSAAGGLVLALLAVRAQSRSAGATLYVIGVAAVSVFIFAGSASSIVGSGFTAEDSYVHRLGIYESIPNLFSRPLAEVLFGGGTQSIQRLFNDGSLQGIPGILVTDSEYVRQFAAYGMVGVGLFVATTLRPLIGKSRTLFGPAMVVFLVGALFFDLFTWRSLMVLWAVLVCLPGKPLSAAKSNKLESTAKQPKQLRVPNPR